MLRTSFLLALTLAVTFHTRSFAVTVDGRTYEEEGGIWFFIDSNDEAWEIAPDLIEVKFNAGVTSTQRDSLATTHGLTLDAPGHSDGYYRYHYGFAADPISVLTGVVASSLVEAAEIAYKIKALGDPYFTFEKQWNAYLIKLDRALAVTGGGSEIVIAIHDFGVDRQHEDLLPTVWTNPLEVVDGADNDNDESWNRENPLADDLWGWNFDTLGGINTHPHDPTPFLFHGTAVAGMAVAANDNNTGLASPGGGNANARPIRWLAVVGTNNLTMADAFKYCLNKGADIINASFAFAESDTRAKNAMIACTEAGILVVAASGNNCEGGGGGVNFPASHDSVLAVGAVDSLLVKWNYSCGGPELDLVAPAGFDTIGNPNYAFHWTTDNYCTDCDDLNPGPCNCATRVPNDKYTLSGGTSSAAPQVAGVAALLWSQRPTLTAAQVRAALRRSARDLDASGRDDLYGHGLVDAYRTVTRWGTITQNTTWSGTIHVSADITVSSGVTLTIDPGTQIYIAEDDNDQGGADASKIEFNVAGTISANGSTSPITIQSMSPTGSWVGLKFQSGSSATLTNVRIKDAVRAVESNVSMTLTNCALTDCETGIDIYSGTTSLTKCTIANNSVSATVVRGSSSIAINKTVIAFNGGPAVRVISGTPSMSNSIVYQNTLATGSPSDADWQTNGTNVYNLNPAFCSKDSGDYRLYASSPAIAPVPPSQGYFGERVGAFDAGCVPSATVSTSGTVAACPAGDNSSYVSELDVSVNLLDADVTRDLDQLEIKLDLADFNFAKVFDPDDAVTANADATSSNGYLTHVTHKAFGGCSVNDAVDVLLNGIALTSSVSLNIRTWDLSAPWGEYSLPDFASFGVGGYPRGPVQNDCSDYNADSYVNVVDFGWFGEHHGHTSEYDPANAPPMSSVESNASVNLSFIEEFPTASTHQLYVDVAVDDFEEVTTCLFRLTSGNPRLTFVEWLPAEQSLGTVMFAPVVRDGEPHIYFGALVSESFSESSCQLGRVVFDVVGTEPFEITTEDFLMTYGEVLTGPSGGQQVSAQMNGVLERRVSGSMTRVYHNRLEQNFPNPFNPATTLAYSVREPAFVNLVIYDVAGRQVRELVNEQRNRGTYRVVWDGKNDHGTAVSSGVYFYKMKAGSFSDTKKMTFLK